MLRRTLFTVVVCLVAAAAQARYAGRPLAEALHDLESKGLRLIYSNDVVRPDMIVRTEPHAAEPRRVLDELLREHHLRATDGPQGTILIVRVGAPAPGRAVPPGAAAPTHIGEITVTPSRFTIYASQPERRQFLSREEVRSTPHFSDDLYRALAHVPGTAGQDVSARFNIRGGKEDEVEVLIDGAEIYDPFHVRDLFRAFSTIDSEAVGAVDVLTGGFPAQYGGRMSGVIDITSLTPSEPRHTEIGVSLLNTRVLSSGLFAHGRAEWLVSARRGYLRELLKLVNNDDNETIDPNYYDLLGKVQTSLDERNVVSANVLFSRDTLSIDDPEGNADAVYRDIYAWVNLRTAISPRLFTQNVALIGKTHTSRTGSLFNNVNAAIDDHRSFQSISLKNDTTFDLSDRNVLKAGVTAKQLRASYDYASDGVIIESLLHINEPPIPVHRRASLRPSGSDVAVYAADRFALGTRLVIEAGLRADRQSYAPDGTHLSPRVNAVFALTPRAALRVAWGRFYQPQGVQELHVQDGETAFGPAERADHALAGIEVDLGRGITARGEVYDKRFSDLRPRFANLFDAMVLFPEVQGDRIRVAPQRGSARGGELLLRKESESRRLGGWISYARASVRDEIDGREVPRSWDQRNTVTFNLSWRPHALWNFAVAGVYHSGWPTTVVEGRFVDGVFHTVLAPLYADRLPAYRRVDVRASRRVPTAHGGFSFFVELFNALGVDNVTGVTGYGFSVTAGQVSKGQRITEAAIGVVPSFGITYEF
ncbi:MAG: TonB-dependent receptor [Acidobacteriota bacterium]